jgi:hypothetical protein
MADWRRLRYGGTNENVDVNLEQVCYIHEQEGRSTIYFAGGKNNECLSLEVEEGLDAIQIASSS